MKENNNKLESLTQNFEALQKDFNIQEETINQLLQEEQLKNEFFMSKEEECNNHSLHNIHLLKEIEIAQKKYWQMKSALGECLMLSPTFNGTKHVQYQTKADKEWAKLAKQQNQKLLKCMDETKFLDNISVQDLEHSIQLIKNEIPVGIEEQYLSQCLKIIKGQPASSTFSPKMNIYPQHTVTTSTTTTTTTTMDSSPAVITSDVPIHVLPLHEEDTPMEDVEPSKTQVTSTTTKSSSKKKSNRKQQQQHQQAGQETSIHDSKASNEKSGETVAPPPKL